MSQEDSDILLFLFMSVLYTVACVLNMGAQVAMNKCPFFPLDIHVIELLLSSVYSDSHQSMFVPTLKFCYILISRRVCEILTLRYIYVIF